MLAAAEQRLYVEALGLPLGAGEDGEYWHSEEIAGSKHFGVWPLSQAAEACFGTPSRPAELTVPQATVEFEAEDAEAVAAAGDMEGQRCARMIDAETERRRRREHKPIRRFSP